MAVRTRHLLADRHFRLRKAAAARTTPPLSPHAVQATMPQWRPSGRHDEAALSPHCEGGENAEGGFHRRRAATSGG